MQQVQLTEQEWQQIIAIIAKAPWDIANPLLMKLSEQLQSQRRYNGPLTESAGFDNPENIGTKRPS